MDLAAGELRGEVKLGATASFHLGELEIRPATRQLLLCGRSITVEPRVMQVLVVLGQAAGEVVTRDELILRCWGGRIVGDNAIHRAVSRLRELAADFAGGAFTVETIPKIGYRLAGTAAAAGVAVAPSPLRHRMAWVSAGAAIAVLSSFALLRLTTGGSGSVLSVEMTPSSLRIAPDLQRQLSAGFAAQGARIQVRPAENEQGDLKLSLAGDAGATSATLYAPRGDVLWSANLSGPAGLDIQPALAARVGELLLCAQDMVSGSRPDAQAWQLAFSTCDQMFEIGSEASIRLLRLLASRYPRLSAPWAYLSLAESEVAGQYRAIGDSGTATQLSASAEAHLNRALRDGDGSVVIAAARIAATRPPDWSGRLSMTEKDLAANPQSALLLTMKSQALQSAGRSSSAISAAREATALDPFSISAETQLIASLGFGGFPDQATSELARADRIWPNSPILHYVRDMLLFRYGNPADLSLTGTTGEEISGSSAVWRGLAGSFLKARRTGAPADIDRAIAESRATWTKTGGGPIPYLQELGQFQRVDEAYALLSDERALSAVRESPEVLFRTHMASIRNDSRFMQLASRLGLLDFWIASGSWPDFCYDPKLAYDCKIEARRLSTSKPR